MSFELILPFLRPIEPLLVDDSVSEIMGNPDATWWYERDGIVCPDTSIQFDSNRLRTGLEVIANHLGKRLDEDNPLLNAQLPDGSRIAAVIPPVVRPAPALTIRKFTGQRFTVDDLIARGTLSVSLAEFLSDQIRTGKTVLISGGTGTGKTTLLNVLAQAIPDEERIVVIEDTAEQYTQARIGGNRAPETTATFIAAKFEHDTARPVDGYVAPQLHTHAVIFNMTERDNGQFRAVQPQNH
jgi:pilus assembly protein CpaF